jgi:hypothetical protein
VDSQVDWALEVDMKAAVGGIPVAAVWAEANTAEKAVPRLVPHYSDHIASRKNLPVVPEALVLASMVAVLDFPRSFKLYSLFIRFHDKSMYNGCFLPPLIYSCLSSIPHSCISFYPDKRGYL